MQLNEEILSLLRSLHVNLSNQEKTVSTAESCTSGLLAYLLTVSPGSSAYYLGGFATYSNAMKMKCLNVTKSILETHGAVSEQTAQQMAKGCLEQTGSDFALATTGIAGPDGGTPDKPIGTVWIALGWKRDNVAICDTECLHLDGSREQIRLDSAITLLKKLNEKVSQ